MNRRDVSVGTVNEPRSIGILLRTALCALILSLAGCNTVDVQEDLTQEQATEIAATLNNAGISATVDKESTGRGKYRVIVKRSSYSSALTLMHERGLPSEPRASFRDMIASRGLVPDSREVEALRLDRALAAEIEETIQNDPAVTAARVIVRMNSLPSGGLSEEKPGVSALLRVRPNKQINEVAVREVIARAIPGVSPEKIFISVSKAEEEATQVSIEGVDRQGDGKMVRVPLTDFLWAWRVPEDDYNSLALGLVMGIVMVFTLGAVIGVSAGAYRRARASEPSNPSMRRLPAGRGSEKSRRDLIDG